MEEKPMSNICERKMRLEMKNIDDDPTIDTILSRKLALDSWKAIYITVNRVRALI